MGTTGSASRAVSETSCITAGGIVLSGDDAKCCAGCGELLYLEGEQMQNGKNCTPGEFEILCVNDDWGTCIDSCGQAMIRSAFRQQRSALDQRRELTTKAKSRAVSSNACVTSEGIELTGEDAECCMGCGDVLYSRGDTMWNGRICEPEEWDLFCDNRGWGECVDKCGRDAEAQQQQQQQEQPN